MKAQTNVKAGLSGTQHNETLVRTAAKPKGLKVKTNLKAGAPKLKIILNHNETLIRAGANPQSPRA